MESASYLHFWACLRVMVLVSQWLQNSFLFLNTYCSRNVQTNTAVQPGFCQAASQLSPIVWKLNISLKMVLNFYCPFFLKENKSSPFSTRLCNAGTTLPSWPAVRFLCSQNLWLGGFHRNSRCCYTSFCTLAYCFIRKRSLYPLFPSVTLRFYLHFVWTFFNINALLEAMLVHAPVLCLTYKINVIYLFLIYGS